MNDTILVLDTETSGLLDPALVELAYKVYGNPNGTTLRCLPDKPIELQATMVNHITNEMVEMLQPFREMVAYHSIRDEIENSIVLAHNAPFDIKVLARDGVEVKRYIDSKEVAKALYPDAPNHQLQGLRYWLKLDIEGAAHTAAGDVDVLEALWTRMITDADGQDLVERFYAPRASRIAG